MRMNLNRWRGWGLSLVLAIGILLWGLPNSSPRDWLVLPNHSLVHAQEGGIPEPIRYGLPPGLAGHVYDEAVGDYLDEIDQGDGETYLQWSYYPVPVYIQEQEGYEEWRRFVEMAVEQWGAYVPLNVVRREEEARITIERIQLAPGISGAARPQLYFAGDGTLQQRVRIVIGEQRGLAEVTAVTRHEIGHALGLWGHSPDPQDLMFGGNHAEALGGRRAERLPAIRARDLNTLKRVYEQPTYMGLVFPEGIRRLYE